MKTFGFIALLCLIQASSVTSYTFSPRPKPVPRPQQNGSSYEDSDMQSAYSNFQPMSDVPMSDGVMVNLSLVNDSDKLADYIYAHLPPVSQATRSPPRNQKRNGNSIMYDNIKTNEISSVVKVNEKSTRNGMKLAETFLLVNTGNTAQEASTRSYDFDSTNTESVSIFATKGFAGSLSLPPNIVRDMDQTIQFKNEWNTTKTNVAQKSITIPSQRVTLSPRSQVNVSYLLYGEEIQTLYKISFEIDPSSTVTVGYAGGQKRSVNLLDVFKYAYAKGDNFTSDAYKYDYARNQLYIINYFLVANSARQEYIIVIGEEHPIDMGGKYQSSIRNQAANAWNQATNWIQGFNRNQNSGQNQAWNQNANWNQAANRNQDSIWNQGANQNQATNWNQATSQNQASTWSQAANPNQATNWNQASNWNQAANKNQASDWNTNRSQAANQNQNSNQNQATNWNPFFNSNQESGWRL